MPKFFPIGPMWAKRITQMWEWQQGFRGDHVKNTGASVYVGSGDARASAAPTSPIGKIVRITAMFSDGVYTAKEIYRDENQAVIDTESNLVFDGEQEPSTTTTGYVYERTGLSGLIVGQIVTVRRRPYVNGQRWEFDAPACVVPVNVTQVGGVQGTVSTPASWTYDVYTKDGTLVLSAVSPQNQRPTRGEVIKGVKGYAQYEPSGGDGIPTFTLGWVNEVPDPFPSGQVPPPYTPGTPVPPYVPSGTSVNDVLIWDGAKWVKQATASGTFLTGAAWNATTGKMDFTAVTARVITSVAAATVSVTFYDCDGDAV